MKITSINIDNIELLKEWARKVLEKIMQNKRDQKR